MKGSLQGKVAVVTGGGEGIGLASAKRLAQEGASVFIVGRRQTILHAAVAEIGGDVMALQADVSRSADLDRVYEAVRASKGGIDILVANAGVQTREPLGLITEEAIDYQLAINFKGVIFTVQQALPLLTDGASIILASSATALPMPAASSEPTISRDINSLRISGFLLSLFFYRASAPVSPVRIRITCSIGVTKILPSPILPVRAARSSASMAWSTISSDTAASIFTLGRKSTTYSAPRYNSVCPF